MRALLSLSLSLPSGGPQRQLEAGSWAFRGKTPTRLRPLWVLSGGGCLGSLAADGEGVAQPWEGGPPCWVSAEFSWAGKPSGRSLSYGLGVASYLVSRLSAPGFWWMGMRETPLTHPQNSL